MICPTCNIENKWGCDCIPEENEMSGSKANANKHPDLIKWEEDHKFPLFIGTQVTIKPTAEYYDEQYDKGKVYMITNMCVDSGGLNLGINDGETDRYSCETDGYYIADIEPVEKTK